MRADEPLAAAGIIAEAGITPAADIIAESRASQVETDGISACYKGSAYRKLYAEAKGALSPGGIAEAALLSRSFKDRTFFYAADCILDTARGSNGKEQTIMTIKVPHRLYLTEDQIPAAMV